MDKQQDSNQASEYLGLTKGSVKMKQATAHVSAHERDERWLLVDAKNKLVGKIGTEIAKLLIGKDQASYNPAVDAKTNVVVINAGEVKFTGNKMADKRYYSHSGYPGGIKETSPERVLTGKHPERVLLNAVSGMLPRNKLRNVMLKRLYIYATAEHPHAGQNPQAVNLK